MSSAGQVVAPNGGLAPGSCNHLTIVTDSGPVYLWTAPGGELQASGRAPFSRDQPLVLQKTDTQSLQFQIRSPGVKLPSSFADELSRSSEYLVSELQSVLGIQGLRGTEIELLLLADRIDFEVMKARIAPELPEVSGFYSIRTNQAVVRYDARAREQARRSAIHEISHLVFTNQLGPLPVWLAEGLAEYFETVQFGSEGAVVPANQRHRYYFSGQELPALEEFFNLSPASWAGEEGPRNYAMAWSLVYFLNQSDGARAALASLLREANANYCMPFNAADSLASNYPGGMTGLDLDWRAWIAQDLESAWSASL